MNPLYLELEQVATELIEEFGKSASVVRKVKGGPKYAPVVTPTPYPATVVDIQYKLTLIPETLIQTGDKVGIMSTTIAIQPDTSDDIVIDGKTYHFRAVEPLNPGGRTLLYEYVAYR